MRLRPASLRTYFLFPLLLPLAFASCTSEDPLSCGDGTKQEGDECVAAGGFGPGGAGDSEDSESGDSENVLIVDRDGRNDDQKLVEKEFRGALAVAPVSSDTVFVAWKPLDVVGLTYNVYIATEEDALSFGTPQYTAPEGAFSFTITNLDEDTEYFIAVVPVLDGFELPVGRTPLSVVPENDDESPSFEGVQSGVAVDGAGVRLEWDAAEDDKSPAEAIRYEIFYGLDDKFAEPEKALDRPFAFSPPGATSMVVFGLPAPETEYFFVVRAVDASGNVDDNRTPKAAKSGKDILAPVFAGCQSAKAVSASVIEVGFTPAKDDVTESDAITYSFYVSESGDFNFSTPTHTVTGGATAQISGLERDTEYFVVCRAEDSSGNQEENERSQAARTKQDGEGPVFDGITATTNLGATSIDVEWATAEDNQSASEAISYILRYSVVSGFEPYDPEFPEPADDVQQVKVVGETTTTLSDLDSNATYYLNVVAVDEGGNASEPSEEEEFTTLVSLRADIEIPIFANKCATGACHAGSAPTANLNLSLGWSYDETVGVDASSGPGAGMKIIVAGDPAASHLVQRISSVEPGFKMPQAAEVFLSSSEIETITTWISQGAPDN